MNIKQNIQDEYLFKKIYYRETIIAKLNENGIYTIEDFINFDFDKNQVHINSTYLSGTKSFKAFQKVLRYKYLGEPLDLTPLLKEYSDIRDYHENAWKEFDELGFGKVNYEYTAMKIIEQKGSCTIMDVILELSSMENYLRLYYTDYYIKHLKPNVIKTVYTTQIHDNIENEPLFSKREQPGKIIKFLNEKGIYTIDEFINCDLDAIYGKASNKKRMIAIQKILKYKYLGEPLTFDILLTKEYTTYWDIKKYFMKDLRTLGIDHTTYADRALDIVEQKGSVTIMDLMYTEIADNYNYLKEFYIEYYETKMINQSNEISTDNLKVLKKELESLIEERNKLDSKISLLQSQIIQMEESNTKNATI